MNMETIKNRQELIDLIIIAAARCGFTQIGRRMKFNIISSMAETLKM